MNNWNNMATNSSWNKKCWNPMKRIYENCNDTTTSVPVSLGYATRRCCIPRGCCIDCDFVLSFLECFRHLDAFTTPFLTGTPQLSFATLEEIRNLLIDNGCLYSIDYASPIPGIFNVVSGMKLTCYDTFVLSPQLLIPRSQCLTFSDSTNKCKPFTICWFMDIIPYSDTMDIMSITDVLFCSGAIVLNVKELRRFECVPCNVATIPQCKPHTLNATNAATVPLIDGTFTMYADFCLDLCCQATNVQFVIIDNEYFNVVGTYVNYGTSEVNPFCYEDILVGIEFIPLTPLGIHTITVLMKSVCGDVEFTINVEIV